MESRREFLRKAALLSGAAAVWTVFPESIQRALAINPETGSTYLDAEHIVILMQENRSFDHSFGTLQGVRGYNDPRAHLLPNLNPVWLQTNADGETFAPFRLNIKETNVTWMGGLPHTWANQVDARNDGHYDKWLLAKPSGYKGYAKKPMTLGHYTREDIPFYYALADAFTICDQHFCSSLTGTYPNRLYLWSGTLRPAPSPDAKAHVYNEDVNHDHEVSWPAFPERLEDAGVSWKIYQNELDLESGLKPDEYRWLANFGCNTLEYFTQYNVRFSSRRRAYLEQRAKELAGEIAQTEDAKKLSDLRNEISAVNRDLDRWSRDNWKKLPQRDKNLYLRAFTVNKSDPRFRDLETLTYMDGATERKSHVPKGDIFHQFRQDVQNGTLPTVSWLVGPEHFSDHPASAWYGAWYVSEALDILTRNPEVWKKTIFILTYDENDGYFDHVPPFVAPNPYKPEAGKVSDGVDATVEFITKEQDLRFRPDYKPRESPIGLGYRVPMVVASPWSRGGCVCSQVFDHTSILQFLETFLSRKTGKRIEEPNLSPWRRTVCGDLTSMFQRYTGEPIENPLFLNRDQLIEEIHRARYKNPPNGFKALDPQEIEEIRRSPRASLLLPRQEKGTRRSCPLPYELYVDGALTTDKTALTIRFKAGRQTFGSRAAGSPFNAYAYLGQDQMQARAYAVSAGKEVSDSWSLAEFPGGAYHIRVDGPNGFMREFKGTPHEPRVEISTVYLSGGARRPTGAIELTLVNHGKHPQPITVSDLSYGGPPMHRTIPAHGNTKLLIDTTRGKGWYDFAVSAGRHPAFSRRYAGRVETGKWSVSDPAMGHSVGI